MEIQENSMSAQRMKQILVSMATETQAWLAAFYKNRNSVPERLEQAMLYSLEAGGKRIRPALCMSCAALCGLDCAKALPFAAAIEMIHTYSLIHDDLPAMDNDDLRRGKPSNHKKFDEATAILAGDGLLTDAFFVISSMDLPCHALLAALHELACAAGSSGMVGGQMLDMVYTGRHDVSLEEVRGMQLLKTGAILRAACVCGALLAEADAPVIDKISAYGQSLGRAFQIADDILDVTESTEVLGKPAGSDEAEGKNTFPALIGLDESRRLARLEAENAKKALTGLQGDRAAFLLALADYTVQRTA